MSSNNSFEESKKIQVELSKAAFLQALENSEEASERLAKFDLIGKRVEFIIEALTKYNVDATKTTTVDATKTTVDATKTTTVDATKTTVDATNFTTITGKKDRKNQIAKDKKAEKENRETIAAASAAIRRAEDEARRLAQALEADRLKAEADQAAAEAKKTAAEAKKTAAEAKKTEAEKILARCVEMSANLGPIHSAISAKTLEGFSRVAKANMPLDPLGCRTVVSFVEASQSQQKKNTDDRFTKYCEEVSGNCLFHKKGLPCYNYNCEATNHGVCPLGDDCNFQQCRCKHPAGRKNYCRFGEHCHLANCKRAHDGVSLCAFVDCNKPNCGGAVCGCQFNHN